MVWKVTWSCECSESLDLNCLVRPVVRAGADLAQTRRSLLSL